MKQLEFGYLPEITYDLQESMYRLSVNIGFCGSTFKKILITSSTPEEGKSFVTVNLARTLGSSGKRVLLVDADLRKSLLLARLRISTQSGQMYGLAHFLAGQVSLQEVVYKTNVPGVDMIPSVSSVVNSTVLLQNSFFASALNELSQVYDYVLVDTPPLGSVSDGDILARYCDGSLLVVRAAFTPQNVVRGSLQQLKRAGCPLMGIVLNRAEVGKNPYYYRYTNKKYRSSYKQYYGKQ